MTDRKLVKRELAVTLTTAEIMEKAKDLAKLQQDKVAAEEQAKSAAATYKDRITMASARINILSRDISNGYEYREVDCEWLYDYKKGKKILIRTDTQETIKTEDITASERQEGLRLEDKKAA